MTFINKKSGFLFKLSCLIKVIERESGEDINKSLLKYSEVINTFHNFVSQ